MAISFDDLGKAMEEFGVALKRPAFLEEKAHPGWRNQPMIAG
jgi:hypothetical protein